MELLITGAEQGLGKAILEEYGPTSYHNIEGEEIKDAYWYGRVKDMADEHVENLGSAPDVVVNNFGVNQLSWIGDTDKFDSMILELNVMLPYWIVNALVNVYNKPCQVLNISSQTYKVPQRCTSLYCASKAALSHMTRVMARELAPKGWVINAYAPGKIVGTKMTRMTDAQVMSLRDWDYDEMDGYARDLIPMGRYMSLEEAAAIAVHILRTPSYVNGTTIEATGGV